MQFNPLCLHFNLTPIEAILWCLFVSLTFVGSIYVWASSRSGRKDRNSPIEIKKRLISVGIACICLLILTIAMFGGDIDANSEEQCRTIWEILGLSMTIPTLYSLLFYVFATVVLFLGPIVQEWHWKWSSYTKIKRSVLESAGCENTHLHVWRNYVFGPMYEEWAFRAIMIPPIIHSSSLSVSTAFCVLTLPWCFGFSHAHHIFQNLRLHGYSVVNSILNALFQITYTYPFGAFTTYVFITTHSLYIPVIIHSLCNVFGVPDFGDAAADLKEGKLVVPGAYAVGLTSFILLLSL